MNILAKINSITRRQQANHRSYRPNVSCLPAKRIRTDDYHEFVTLTMVILIGLSSIIQWKAPGPIRYAHWIATLLYAMKIYIFCNQCHQEDPRIPIVVCFSLTRKEETLIHRCAQCWCPSLYNQRSHLLLMHLDKILLFGFDLWKYKLTDKRALENPLWYLSDEAVCLALFSDQLSITDRVKSFDRITAKPNETKMRGDPTIPKEGSCLSEFAIQQTPTPLSSLTNDDSFLLLP